MKERTGIALLIGMLLLLLAACSSGNQREQGPPQTVPVMAETVIQKHVPVQLHTIGTVEAYSTVSVKAQVSGEVTRVHFKEGQDVKKGDPLFTIDPRPFEASLRQAEANLTRSMAQVKQAEANLTKAMAQVKEAEANLERDTAQLNNAEEQARRYEFLIGKGVVSRELYDRFRTNAEALEATVRADKAALENAKAAVSAARASLENAEATVQADRALVEHARIQLGYCSIASPIEGRTGNLIVNVGNIVKANETPYLIVINQVNPISVTFSLPERHLSEIKRYMAQRKLTVEALIPNDEKKPEQGVLEFIDNTVDTTTGTIRLKGTFANQGRRLWPGQFVNVTLTITTQPDAILIPSQALQTGQNGQYVFVIKPDFTVEVRPVVVSRTMNHETIIEKGLAAGEKVVTDGQLQLVPGVKVEVKGHRDYPEKGS